MKTRILRIFLFLIAILVIFISIPVYANDPVYIAISEEILPLQNGTNYQLSVSYDTEEAKNYITWYTTDSSVATVSPEGRISAVGTGEAIVFAEYDHDFIMSDACTVRVLDDINKVWGKKDDIWYLYKGTNCLTGWQYVGNTWYYMNASGEMLTGWQIVNGKWYYMSDSGAMQTGWQFIDGKWYFLNPSGDMVYGWLKRGNTWYYLGTGGAMQTGWQFINGKWYYMDSSGAMLTGWQYVNNRWYYMNASGAMLTGWQKIGGFWYLLSESGAMLTGWQKLGNTWYFMKDSGQMVTETYTIDGYQHVFHTNGAWISTSAMDAKAQGYPSNTQYLVLVSLSDKVTKIYKKYGSSWAVEQAFLCTVGDPSKGWDTVSGSFYIGQSSWGNPTWKGYSFNDSDGHTLYYWTRFYDGWLFHSILYDNGTWNESTYGNGLGQELSHGCVRLRWYNAKWIYDNVPYGSKVVVY